MGVAVDDHLFLFLDFFDGFFDPAPSNSTRPGFLYFVGMRKL